MSESETSCSPEHGNGLSSITHHCILHTVQAITPRKGISQLLPQSGSHNISSFCKELAQLVRHSSNEKLLFTVEDELVPQITIQNFFSGVMSEKDFTSAIEKALVEATNVGGIDLLKLHKICWEYYREAKKSEISFPKWLSSVCMFRLWLVFNQCLDHGDSVTMATVTMNEILHRIIVLCSYSWNESYGVSEEARGAGFMYPQFLECITDYFEMFKLNTSLTAEVIADLEDEIVHGVLKKGYLEKKGHVRRNWRRRWFILKRTILSYYTTDKKVFKGELVLNAQTKVNSLDDKGSRKNMFLVTCGATEKPFTISADHQKMKHDWMLAIRKAIALAKVAEDGEPQAHERKELEQALSGFFLLKYGTDQPLLRRQDSDIEHIKHHTTKRKFRNIQKIAKELEAPPTGHTHPGEEDDEDERDDYVPMRPGFTQEAESSSSDEDGYCHMEKVNRSVASSSSSGPVTPLTAGADSILTFSLPHSTKTGSQDNVFNPDKAGLKSPDRPAQLLPKVDSAAKREKTGLEDSFYEECGPQPARYIPGERYVDIKHNNNDNNFEESHSPTKITFSGDSTHQGQESYLTILPSPKATPPPEDLPSPTHPSTNGPPVPPRRCTSPNLRRHPLLPSSPSSSSSSPSHLPPSSLPIGGMLLDEDPPIPPPRNTLSPLSSPTHPLPSSSSPQVPARRKTSVPHSNPITESSEYKEDVARLMKRFQSTGTVTPSNTEGGTKTKPAPPPRPRVN